MFRPLIARYDLVLVNSPARDYSLGLENDETHRTPPMGLGNIATYLDVNGYKVCILDAEALIIPIQGIVELLNKVDTRYVGFNAVSENIGLVARMVNEVKHRCVIGGIHASLAPEEVLQLAPKAFAVVHGEGEKSMLRMLDGVANEDNAGLAYWDGSHVHVNHQEPFIDLAEMPVIDRKFFEETEDFYVFTSRGCPHNCAFCASPVLSRRLVRYEPMSKVIQEVRMAYENGYSLVRFMDDQFLISRKRAQEFLVELKKAGLYGKIEWRAMARANVLLKMQDDMLYDLYESGGRSISIGIESGCERILKMVHKGTTNGMVKNVVKKLVAIGFTVKGFLILGFPTESYKEMLETRELIMELGELGLAYFNLAVLRPYPGTEIYSQLIGHGLSPEDFFYEKSEDDGVSKYTHGMHNRFNTDVRISEVADWKIRQLVIEIVDEFTVRFS